MRTDRLAREYPLTCDGPSSPLHPETPEEGRELADLFAGREADIPAMLARLEKVAAEVGLSLARRTRTYNSRRAQELGKWAESLGQGEPFHRAVYHAYFAEGRNIALTDELLRIAESAGLLSRRGPKGPPGGEPGPRPSMTTGSGRERRESPPFRPISSWGGDLWGLRPTRIISGWWRGRDKSGGLHSVSQRPKLPSLREKTPESGAQSLPPKESIAAFNCTADRRDHWSVATEMPFAGGYGISIAGDFAFCKNPKS